METIKQRLKDLHQQTIDGEVSNLDALIEMRKVKVEAESLLEIIKEFESDRLNEISIEAESYGSNYCGYEIKAINGRKMYSFKNCPIVNELDKKKKEAEEFYKSGFEGYQKGVVQAKEVDGVYYWLDIDGDLQPFPELTIGKSFLQIKDKNK